MVDQPLVSVIALSYNHAQFLEEALQSVAQQSYSAIELILVDDASTDASVTVAQSFLQENPVAFPVKTCFLPKNQGNCVAFNRGLALATGKYVIDFATDDIMLLQRIAQQVAYFESLPSGYGVVFSEAEYVDETGKHLWFHYCDQLKHLRPIPEGNVYVDVLAYYFVSPPTMMIKKKVLDELGGYDEQLAYEDFDFWVRSARNWKYAYLDKCTTQVRKHAHSLSSKQYRRNDPQLYSTYLVCQKAFKLNRADEEHQALAVRLKYELRQALLSGNLWEAKLMMQLLRRLRTTIGIYPGLLLLAKFGFPLRWGKRVYQYFQSF
ncbi:MAG: glycosyltransferase [Bacteroidota bacterium]